MRKRVKGKKFGRERGPRKHFLQGLVASLFLKEKIRTTEARAKAIRPIAEKLLTRAKKGGLANYRILLQRLPKGAAKKAFEELGRRYAGVSGGYTRLTKLARRKGDAAPMALIELVQK
ncbi:50S ribosomal protein L17 [Candidatus Azambacteria bacterium]|nr:50S ribosomal protein L17 [Candidatus Azambacteria bacterium]